MPEFIVEQTLILDTEDQAKAAERAQQIATFLAHDWPELTLVHTGDVEPCPPFIESDDSYNPWWGDRCVAAAEAERLARQEDRREAEAFQARIDSNRPAKVIRDAVDEAWGVRRDECCGDPADCGSCS